MRAVVATALLVACVLAPVAAPTQTFTVLHSFLGNGDGATPFGGLTLDAAGNLYGTASAGGFTQGNCAAAGCGVVFKLARHGSSWIYAPLYAFQGGSDGAAPYAGVAVAPDGILYGTTLMGGIDCGVVFKLQPEAHAQGRVFAPWIETPLVQFAEGNDGCYPAYGTLVLDSAGNIYGTTYQGGVPCDDSACGTVFKLASDGFTEYDFPGREAGGNPLSGVVLDNAGNLYGATSDNNFASVVYELTPTGSGWTETVLFTLPFSQNAHGGVTFDASGDLVGTTLGFEVANIGNTVYQLSSSCRQWRYSLLYNLGGPAGSGPWSGVTQGQDGSLYGTTCSQGPHQDGSVFKLTPTENGWTESDLYYFTGGSDGSCPVGEVVLDANGDIFGTSAYGGTGYGVIWEITP